MTTLSALPVTPLKAEALDHRSIAHGFFTREGGVSHGLYEGLNCGLGSDDDRTFVLENRRRVADTLGAETLLTCYQVHSPSVVTVEAPWTPEAAPQADAMVTRVPGIALGILTADCAPVLFAAPNAGLIGAAHAGWKGAFGGVLEATVDCMVGLGADRADISAVVGPSISQKAYEVGPEFLARFTDADAGNKRWFIPSDRADHYRFDLPGYAVHRLHTTGIGQVADLGVCTYADEKRFFSFRRTTHRGESDYGRQVSAIMLAG